MMDFSFGLTPQSETWPLTRAALFEELSNRERLPEAAWLRWRRKRCGCLEGSILAVQAARLRAERMLSA